MTYNKPYVLWRPSIPNKHCFEYQLQERKTDPYTFGWGKKLPFVNIEFPHLTFTNDDPSTYDLIFHSEIEPEIFKKYDCPKCDQPFLLVNQKVKDILLDMCPDDVQFFPATIVPENSKKMSFENHDYWVLNITRLVDAFDMEKSELILYDDGEIRNIKQLYFKDDYDKNFYIGRESLKTLSIVVSPELVQRFKKEKITGVKFLKDYEYGVF